MKPNKVGLKLAMLEQIAGISIDDIIDSLPKGSTPNRYQPHQGKREMERRARKMKGLQA